MAVGKEIRTQIRSVQNTQKITAAMEMVAASKLRRSQERMNAARPYADRIAEVMHHIAHAQPEVRSPFLTSRDTAGKVAYLVITTDRGLCGGLNTNLLRATVLHMKEQHEQGKSIEIAAVGNKAVGFFRRQGGEVKYVVNGFGELADPTVLHGPVAGLVNDFERGELDTIYICCNNFVNTMTQRPEVSPLVPVSAVDGEGAAERRIGEYIWDYIYEPDAETVLNLIIRRYIDSRVYRSVVENIACEMAARMVAMKAASDNAGELIDELQLAYNKARQAAITQEIAEIVGGAAAV